MGRPLRIDLFVEDRAHEEFLKPLVRRMARERGRTIHVSVRCARGGHGRALSELELYQKAVAGGVGDLVMPDLVVVGIDGNCQPHRAARQEIRAKLNAAFRDRAVIACPAPHVERWFLADAVSFSQIVGASASVRKAKCQRDYYKRLLARAVVAGGHVPTLGGIEFAQEIVEAMDLYRAGKTDKSLRLLIDELGKALKSL
ncbi:MAG: hypothetical protein HRF43_07020 [Phycisphaerae bacterium]|jgi:hypothetical protein